MAQVINLVEGLKYLGITEGDTLLVHSSLKSLGGPGPDEVINALVEVLGQAGTLVMPALSYEYVGKHNKVFDYKNTPSNVGLIPEYFRTTIKSVLRSMSPTHSCCALGKHADFITKGHILDNTPCGSNSPFFRLKTLKGKVLFIGCGLRPNTSMHGVEELYRPDYLFGDSYDYHMTDRSGNSFVHSCASHNFKGVTQRYDRLEGLLEKDKDLFTGYVGDAFCYLIDIDSMWKKAGDAYSINPHYFIDLN